MREVQPFFSPISQAMPSGVDMVFSHEFDVIREARREDDPTLDQGAWVTEIKQADWPLVLSVSQKILLEQSKDLRVAGWWCEASSRISGLDGLAQGLQLVAGLCSRYWDSMHHERFENRVRFSLGMVGMVGTFAEATGKWIESAQREGNRLAIKLEKWIGKFLRGVGRGLGGFSGVVLGIMDFHKGVSEYSEGNYAVDILYAISGSAAVGAALAFLPAGKSVVVGGLSMTGWGVVLVIAALFAAGFVAILKDDKLQDWLERCYFGNFEADARYPNAEVELVDLDIAIKDVFGA